MCIHLAVTYLSQGCATSATLSLSLYFTLLLLAIYAYINYKCCLVFVYLPVTYFYNILLYETNFVTKVLLLK